MPFGQQMMQSPPFSSQFNPQFSAMGTSFNSSPPQWSIQIIEDIKSIKRSVSKIESIEKTVNKISSKVETLETKMKTMDSKVTEVENSNKFISDEFDKTKQKHKSASDDVKRLNDKCKNFEVVVQRLESQNKNLGDKTNDLEFRSLRENLLFHGIPKSSNENCELLVKEFISRHLEIGYEILIDTAHRLGKPKTKTRPIVVKSHYYNQRELIRTTANDKIENLRALNLGVGVQQTKAVLQKRRDMSAIYDREKLSEGQLEWAGARILVRGSTSGNFREVSE